MGIFFFLFILHSGQREGKGLAVDSSCQLHGLATSRRADSCLGCPKHQDLHRVCKCKCKVQLLLCDELEPSNTCLPTTACLGENSTCVRQSSLGKTTQPRPTATASAEHRVMANLRASTRITSPNQPVAEIAAVASAFLYIFTSCGAASRPRPHQSRLTRTQAPIHGQRV